jgi:RimJ/RimL family protein N-acetyltransferase
MTDAFLRAIETADLDRIHRWHNSPELYETLGGVFRFVGREQVEEWLRLRLAATNEVNLAICRIDDSAHIGNVYLRNIDWISRNAEFHIFLGEPAQRRQGVGSAATKKMLSYAFDILGLRRIYLYVLEENEAAIHVYKKCGFRVEGNLRDHVYKGGRFQTLLLMGILAAEFGG